jgi:hypothetical protein
LPHKVVSYWSYTEGAEKKKYVDSNGNPSKSVKSVVIQDYDLEHFQQTPPASKWDKRTPLQRFEQFKKSFPNGRKLLREERHVDKGGWWYVKETPNTSSKVRFDRKNDKFFAPTLEESLQLFLDSKKNLV